MDNFDSQDERELLRTRAIQLNRGSAAITGEVQDHVVVA